MKTQTKFFEFDQNNSGGYFDVDENVCHRVIIEANDRDHAVSIFEPMIENESPSCDCCGNRWSFYCDEVDLSEYGNDIEQYCQEMANRYGWTSPDSRIHYLDGTKKEIFQNKQQ